MPALAKIHPAAAATMVAFHADVIQQVSEAVRRDKVVVVGMGWNPVVKSVRKFLDNKGVKYTYLGYGNYMSGWKVRLAIKLWSGWPTFPQVFINGALVGGFKDTEALAAKGELDRLIAG